MERVRLPPRPENIEQHLYELGCTQEQVERHLTALRHQRDNPRQSRVDNTREREREWEW
jgi:hypothetical protein